jgi:hypothetical protein
MNEIIFKIVDFPNQAKIEETVANFGMISQYIKEFEDESNLNILKQITPQIENVIEE